MNNREIDILSQILEVLLDGKEVDANHLDLLEKRLLDLTSTPNQTTQNGFEFEGTDFQEETIPTEIISGSNQDDPFAFSSPPPASTLNPAPESPTPNTMTEVNKEEVLTNSIKETLETEIDLLKEELKESKKKVSHFEGLYQRKKEEAGSQQQMAEMTIKYILEDVQKAQQYGVNLLDLQNSIQSLLEGISPDLLSFWFPDSFVWTPQGQEKSKFCHYYIEHYSIRYVMAFSLSFEPNIQPVTMLLLRLMLETRVKAERYTNPALVYEVYEEAVMSIANALSIEPPADVQGVIVAFDQESLEMAISGKDLTIYQKEGAIINTIDLGMTYTVSASQPNGYQQLAIKYLPIKPDNQLIIPLSSKDPVNFKEYLQDTKNHSAEIQQEKLNIWQENEEQLPEDFSVLQIKIS